MILSIHDVPRYERHLLFCSQLDRPRRLRRRLRRDHELPAINRTLAVHGEAVAGRTLLPGPLGLPAPACRAVGAA